MRKILINDNKRNKWMAKTKTIDQNRKVTWPMIADDQCSMKLKKRDKR